MTAILVRASQCIKMRLPAPDAYLFTEQRPVNTPIWSLLWQGWAQAHRACARQDSDQNPQLGPGLALLCQTACLSGSWSFLPGWSWLFGSWGFKRQWTVARSCMCLIQPVRSVSEPQLSQPQGGIRMKYQIRLSVLTSTSSTYNPHAFSSPDCLSR